jgi:hypothetical protein
VSSLPIAFESPISFEILDKDVQAEVIKRDDEPEEEEGEENDDAEEAL